MNNRIPTSVRRRAPWGTLRTSAIALLWMVAASVALPLPGAGAQFAGFSDEVDQPLRSGLLAQFSGPDGTSVQRIDDQISFDWGAAAPDPRISEGAFTAEWAGQLFARPSGMYRLHLFVQGAVKVEIDEAIVVEGSASEPRWITSEEIRLSVGYHPLRVTYSKTENSGRLGLYWSGPDFGLEPISANAWFHEPGEAAERVGQLEHGRQLVDALRCVACHELPGSAPLMPAPSLEKLSGNIEPAWLVEMLRETPAAKGTNESESGESGSHPHRNMPGFGFSEQTAADVAAALLEASKPAASKPAASKSKSAAKSQPASPNKPAAKSAKKPKQPDPKRGEQLLTSVGCLACHVYEDLGKSDLYGGGDLTAIAEKRPADFFQRWLRDPAAVNAQHRMPTFALTAEEQADLAAFLATLSGDSAKAGDSNREADAKWLAAADLQAGRQAIAQAGCVSCHALPTRIASTADTGATAGKAAFAPIEAEPLTAESEWELGCLAGPKPERRQPGYRLSAEDAEAVEQYIRSLEPTVTAERLTARDLLRRSQCLACHPRGAGGGISDTALSVAARYSDVVAHVAALIPPSLNSVGDKLRDEPLREAIAGKAKTHRPWLSVRMPQFPLSASEIDQLAEAFVATDRVPAGGPTTASRLPSAESTSAEASADEIPSDVALRTVGARLVTSSGFGCTSCHAIGEVQPGEAPVSSLGPNLRELGKRVRPEWFRRWVANPLRIVPRVEMPAIVTPVSGVLDNHLEHQVDAVWHVLNLPDFKPPKPNPVRVVRKQGIESAGERAAVITDVLHHDGGERIKPLLIGLPNRQNIVFDLAEARIDGWWSGDAAYQRTEGKRWFWETPAANLWPAAPNSPGSSETSEWLLVREGNSAERLVPQRTGQFLTEVDRWEHVADGGLRFSHRLHFAAPSTDAATGDPAAKIPTSRDAYSIDDSWITVVIEQTIRPRWSPDGKNLPAWSREIRVPRLPEGWRLLHRPLPFSAEQAKAAAASGELTLTGAAGASIRVALGPDAAIDSEGWLEIPAPEAAESGNTTASGNSAAPGGRRMEYSAEIPVDQYPLLPTEAAKETVVQLEVLPGFTAEQLALPQNVMPTALSWHPDGSLYITDLKGPVWHVTDSDDDGTLDTAKIFSDDLATPFGIYAHEDYIDVINKYALLRLWDDSGDGFADRVETLASGWGHSADYHDWAIGLPQTEDGAYYVTLACQQDKRSRAAANLRGTVIRLNPRKPSPTRPHRYEIEVLTAGHRFPIGIAQDRDGEVYVTDNQGNYKPFNELNRIVPGDHFGFINLLDRQLDDAPERTPPAIDIPHPWTRSVNGICFLNTPSGIDESRFGPFEGHLVGCEYDTRRLVRMSLQRVGDQMQGAAYPFTYDTPAAGPPLLGPISCAVSPDGQLFVGNIRESGWGAGANIGNLVRFRYRADDLPAGIAEVRATARGFEIRMTRPVDASKAIDPKSYTIASYTRVSTPSYGGEDLQRRSETIESVRYDADRQTVVIELPEMRRGFVYEFEVAPLVDEGQPFFPAEAFYTLRELVSADSRSE